MKTIPTLSTVLLAAMPSLAASPYTWNNAVFDGGGFVSGILYSRTQPGLLYARTDVGGAYRWDSTGNRWTPLMDWVSQLDAGWMGVLAMAVDPSDSKRLYLQVGTDYFSGGKTAILRSRDYGATFDTINVTSKFKAHGNAMGRNSGEKLAVDPRNSGIIYSGSQLSGLWKSVDTGSTWTQASTLGANASGSIANDIGVSFVLFDPASPALGGATSRILMGLGKTSSNLYRSDDAGTTFTPIAGGPTGQMPLRAQLVGDTLYLAYSNGTGPYQVSGGSLWKHSLSAKTWTNITPMDSTSYYGSGGQGFANGFGGISVDPADHKHLVASTINYYGNQWRWANKSDGWGDRIFVSRDGGATWTHNANLSNDGTNTTLDAGGSAWIDGNSIHWAASIEFDPFHKGRVLVVSGNGVFGTDDIDAASPVWSFRSRGIEETVPLEVVSVEGGPLVTAIGDYDGARYDDPMKGAPRHSPSIGTTQSLGYGPKNGTFLRAGYVTDYSTGTGISSNVMYFSKDTARTWTQVETVKGTHGLVVLNNDGSVFLHRPENQTTVYRSVDHGKTWTTSTGLDGQSNGARIVADPLNAAVFYLLDGQGYLWTSSDSGSTFTKGGRVQDEPKGLLQNSSMLIRTVPGKEGHLWIPLDQCQSWQTGGYSRNGLALTEDGGKTFTRFPAVNLATAVGLGKAAPGASYYTIFIWGAANGGPVGVYRSTDKGASWERVNDDAHQFGGPGNAGIVQGDLNVFGRVYMTSIGRGLICGTPSSNTGVSERPRTARTAASIERIGRNLRIVAAGVPSLRLELRDASGRILSSRDVRPGELVSLAGMRGIVFARLLGEDVSTSLAVVLP